MEVTFASEPGSESPNEDAVAIGENMIAVLDGTTSRTATGCVHGVPWFVEHLAANLVANESLTPSTTLGIAISETAAAHSGTCDLRNVATPASFVGIIHVCNDLLQYLVLGDVTLLIDSSSGLHVITDDRVSRTATAERARADQLPNDSPEKTSALVIMKQAELAARNAPGGYWVAAADPDAVKHAIVGKMNLRQIRRIALLTDGAARAVHPLGLYDWPGALTLIDTKGPEELIRQVRAAELTDVKGLRWPRNKTHDDATAVLVEP